MDDVGREFSLTEIRPARSPEDIELARQLFKEYAAWLEISLCFQNFEQELAALPGDYAPPAGRLSLLIEPDNWQAASRCERPAEASAR